MNDVKLQFPPGLKDYERVDVSNQEGEAAIYGLPLKSQIWFL